MELFLYLSAITLCLYQVYGDEEKLKMKKVSRKRSCSTNKASSHRMSSLFIMEELLTKLDNIATVADCYTGCHGNAGCQYMAYREKTCMYFKNNLNGEAISRLMSEGWKYGRIDQHDRLRFYHEEETCTDTYCQDSCLKQVVEKCQPHIYKTSDCRKIDSRRLELDTCDKLRKVVKENPSEGLTPAPAEFLENDRYDLTINGQVINIKCWDDVDYSIIHKAGNGGLCVGIAYIAGEDSYRPMVYGHHCQVFAFDREKGSIFRLFDPNQLICQYQGGNRAGWLLVNSHTDQHCRAPTRELRLKRTAYDTLQFGDRYCYQPYNNNGVAANGIRLATGTSCRGESDNQLIFPNARRAAVKVSFYNTGGVNGLEELVTATYFPDQPEHVGRVDGFDAGYGTVHRFGIRMQAYFIAPQTGSYYFYTAVDNKCFVYISPSQHEAEKVQQIHQSTNVLLYAYYQLDASKSPAIMMEVGKKYYIELVGWQFRGESFFSLGVEMPDGATSMPISFKYLEEYD